ncbi:hypothetical protein OXPF_40100 [Oxobacter pfennigii]|uniref:Uncharacterized protein n=1 Tax=Oxobacter pfennigii TaxID=36849 RepID=A0A0P8WVF0_9CLOT|nr:hypothetical protein OXPF_40100 [Oxobacter pfennigii]
MWNLNIAKIVFKMQRPLIKIKKPFRLRKDERIYFRGTTLIPANTGSQYITVETVRAYFKFSPDAQKLPSTKNINPENLSAYEPPSLTEVLVYSSSS